MIYNIYYRYIQHMNSIERFSKYLDSIEYPEQKCSWNIAGIIKGQNAFYKIDVGNMIKESENKYGKKGSFNTEADKMVFEFKDRWVILDIEELNKYVKKNNLKDLELNNVMSKLEWTLIVLK